MPSVFFLTGSSRGLGRAIAEAVLQNGHHLVATARNPGSLDDLQVAHGDQILPLALDVTDADSAQAAIAAAVERFGRLDVVINNAGYEDLAFFSIGGRLATAGLSAYQSAKWAVGGFSSALAAEVAPLGIRVTVLEPGGMQADWAGSSMHVPPISEPYRQTVGKMAAIHNSDAVALGDPAKVAQVVLQVAAMDDPPLRLILGSEAYAYAAAAARVQAASDERWHQLSSSTDRDDATDAQRDPLG